MNKLLTILTVFALLWLPLAACSGSSSPSEPAPPPGNGGGGGGATTDSVSFATASPPCGSDVLLDVVFAGEYSYASEHGTTAEIKVNAYNADGVKIASGNNHNKLPLGSTGTFTADASGGAPGEISARVEILLREQTIPREVVARTEIECEHRW